MMLVYVVLVLFFQVIPRQQTSTLFPYTTLFRSIAPCLIAMSLHDLPQTLDSRVPRTPGLRDRKSTRLNSSHLGISYAVFCLKKKKWYHDTLIVPQDAVKQ